MRINPILQKDIRIESRSIKKVLGICIYNLIMLVVFMIFMAVYNSYGKSDYMSVVEGASLLVQLFPWIVGVQCAVIGCIVPIITAGAISGERERQTLDLLLTTPIKPSAIIRGKTLSAITRVMIFVISSLPIMCLSFVVGGLSWFALLEFLVLIIVMAIHIGSLGVMFSAIFKKSITATIVTMVTSGVIYVGSFFVNIFIVLVLNPVTMFIDSICRHVYYLDISEAMYGYDDFGVMAKVFGFFGWTLITVILTLLQAWIFRIIAAKIITPYNKRSNS